MRIIRDAEIERTLRTMSEQILHAAGQNPEDVRLMLVDSTDINAFVAHGRIIHLNAGLILATKNPLELAGVIAHETGHIGGGHLPLRHETHEKTAQRAMVSTVIGILAAIGTGNPDLGAAITEIGASTATGAYLLHSREQESFADRAAVSYLETAGLSPRGLVSFLGTLERESLLPQTSQSVYLQTHPLTTERIEALRRLAACSPTANAPIPKGWTEDYLRMKAKLRGFLRPERVNANYDPKDMSVSSRYARAIALFRLKDAPRAEEELATLIAAEPDNPFFHELLGQLRFESGQGASAMAPLARAVDLASNEPLIRVLYAHALIEHGDPDTAIDQLLRALADEQNMASAHRLLARAYGLTGQPGAARLHEAENAYLQGDRDGAASFARRAKALLPKDSPAYTRAQDILEVMSD